jgi:hypothetical protein
MSNGLDFSDPYEMLLFTDDNLLNGVDKLHSWQIQFMRDFALSDYTSDSAFKACVRAANGSGKDKYIIAACVVWFSMHYADAVSVVTSSSGTQLDRQTNKYIQQLAVQFNAKIGQDVWKVNYRHYECLLTRSTIELFVTDEPGRAEGWHPVVTNGKMAIFVSEAKSVPDEIFTALARCTGFTHRVDVSSPGLPMGHFFNVCTGAVKRKDLQTIKGGEWIEYHITAYDCSHLSASYIEELKRLMPGGENGAAFKSAVLAEFGTTDEMVVIPYGHIWKSVNRHTLGWIKEPNNTGGLDLSAGGDETVLSIRNGNKLLKVIPFRFDNTQDTILFLEEKFKQHGLDNQNALVWTDAGGLGKPIIDQLRSRGWGNIRYVLNQAKAYNERVYINRGAEMWFNFGKLLETGEVWLLNDDKLTRQLASRYYKITEGNKHKLESKLQARASGRLSPDRADSVVLCYSNYKSKLDEQEIEKPFVVKEPEDLKPQNDFSLKDWATSDEDLFNLHGYQRVSEGKIKDQHRITRQIGEINAKAKIK